MGQNNTESENQNPKEKQSKKKPVVVLVIQSDDYEWEKIFKGKKLENGRPIKIEQTGWNDISVSSQSTGHAINVHFRNKHASAAHPDFLLIRNEVYTSVSDHRNILFAFMYANIPSVNNLQSIYNFCERPIIFSE